MHEKIQHVDNNYPVSLQQQVNIILTSVDNVPEYRNVVTAIEAWDDARLNLNEVRAKLIEEADRIKETEVQHSRFDSSSRNYDRNVPAAQRKIQVNDGNNQFCKYCKRPDHT